jgi:hypothetical protein
MAQAANDSTTSRLRTTRRAILAGAASLPAALGSGASFATPADSVSFPELVSKFIPLRERWRAQVAIDEVHSTLFNDLFQKATGFSVDEWRSLLGTNDLRWKEGEAAFRKISNENPSDDDDEDGCSIAWNELNGELCPLAEEMLSRTPQSLADLAWQAEVLFLTEPELDDDDEGDGLHWQFIKNVRALGGVS